MKTQVEEDLEVALKLISGATLNDNQRGRADGSMLLAAARLLEAVLDDIRYSYNDMPLGSQASKEIIMYLERARLFGDGLVPTGLHRGYDDSAVTEITFATKGMGLKTAFIESELWIEEWLWSAYNGYKRSGGFAGLTLKKYVSRMRPESEAPKKKRLFGKQIDSEETVDEEVLYNVKRKVRQKAPRLKVRMGRI